MTYARTNYSYNLPPELIAQEATHPAHDARMMVIDRESGAIEHETTFFQLDQMLPENRVIFFNNSRVIPSRLRLKNVGIEHKIGTQGVLSEGEIFFLKHTEGGTFDALVKPGNKFKAGTKIYAFGVMFHVEDISETGRILSIEGGDIVSILKQFGELPLPPYINYTKTKEEDYQTVFAKHDGSVAAPTASLHFTHELLEKLPHEKRYITLHVGLGTFQGINTDDVRDYDIHGEQVDISLELFNEIYEIKKNNKYIAAVGTTVCRTLESLPYLWVNLQEGIKYHLSPETRAYWDSITETMGKKDFIHHVIYTPIDHQIQFETTIYITPGHHFRIVHDLITNFHLPESSLLVLVSAFLGYEKTMNIYTEAREKKYRFYSFGDGMYIRGKT